MTEYLMITPIGAAVLAALPLTPAAAHPALHSALDAALHSRFHGGHHAAPRDACAEALQEVPSPLDDVVHAVSRAITAISFDQELEAATTLLPLLDGRHAERLQEAIEQGRFHQPANVQPERHAC